MEKHIPKAETRYDDMAGAVSINFNDDLDFQRFAEKVAGVNLQKYQPISLRIFIHNEVLITIYALDKDKFEAHRAQTGKLLVKKFKVEVAPFQLIEYIKQIDCTMVSGEYRVEDFEVIN